MKKSFMTRVLAMGLSFAMVFSLSAATNVTTASAAAKKVGVTTMMKVSTKSVTEGKTVKTYMNSTALKKYRIKKVAKLSATADKYIDVDVITSGKKARQGLEITAHEGAVTAAKLTKKGVYVTIYFAQTTSATKAAKATAVKYAKLKVAVNAKPVEKTTMTAAATKVKQITVTFNKAVDTSKAEVTVKKNSAAPTISSVDWATDGKSAEINLGVKLTAGEYAVTVKGVADEELTATVIAEDEKLASFKVSEYLIENEHITNGLSYATVSFKCLNQYGDMMAAPGTVNANCTFGTVTDSAVAVEATATRAGKVIVTKIPDIMAIQGNTGRLILVDNKTGVTANADITYSPASTASTLEFAGFYNQNTAKFSDITNGDTISNYLLLFTAKDQYDNVMDATAINDSTGKLSFTTASGLTNIVATTSAVAYNDKIVDGKDYVSVLLVKSPNSDGKAATGTITFTVVNSVKGLVATQSYEVGEGTVISNFTVDSTVAYGEEENSLDFTATDANGKEIKDFATLDKTVAVTDSNNVAMKWKKQADGSAKLVYKPNNVNTNPDTDTDSQSVFLQIKLNQNNVASNFKYLTDSITVKEKRAIKAVAGVKSDVTLAANSGAAIKLKKSDLIYADQYSNEIKSDSEIYDRVDEGKVTFAIKDAPIATASGISFTSPFALTDDGTPYITITPTAIGSTTLFMLYKTGADTASSAKYDAKTTIVGTNTKDSAVADITVKSINKGNAIKVVQDGAVSASALEVVTIVGKIAGSTAEIDSAQINVKSIDAPKITADDVKNNIKKKEGKVVYVVSIYDGGKEIPVDVEGTFTYALSDQTGVASVAKKANAAVTAGGTAVITGGDLKWAFTLKNIFGDKLEIGSEGGNVTGLDGLKYSAVVIDAEGEVTDATGTRDASVNDLVSVGSGTAKFQFDKADGILSFNTTTGADHARYKIEVTITAGDKTETNTIWVGMN